jgi:hypothetical protein
VRSADQVAIPERRAAIGSPQEMTDDEEDFLKMRSNERADGDAAAQPQT